MYHIGIHLLAMSPVHDTVSCIRLALEHNRKDSDNRGKNLPTILVGRFIQGAAGSVGATLVGGTISDIYVPHEYAKQVSRE
jgi:MFS family permease